MSDAVLPEGATLGEALRTVREAAGRSVEEVSATTRIRATLIRDLEADRFESSGAPVYARGHVRAMALAVGADPAPYLELFTRQVGGEPPSALLATPAPAPPPDIGLTPLTVAAALHVPTAGRPERRGPNWLAAAAAALGVLVVLFAVGQLTKPSPRSSDAALTPTQRATASVAPSTPPASPPNLSANARPDPTGADLRVRLIGGDSWISVRNAAGTLFEGVLRNGAIRDFRDPQQLRLIVGNAGAVNLVCSGRDLGPAGGQGAVRRFTCDANGLVPA